MSTPKIGSGPKVKIIFDIDGVESIDYGYLFTQFEFKAMINGGYTIKFSLLDNYFNILTKLIENGYLDKSRRKAVFVRFKIESGPSSSSPESSTKEQIAIISSATSSGSSNNGLITFTAIDPPSWYLSTGDAAGTCITGNVSSAIRNVVARYAPHVNLDISDTTDNKKNKFWMYRMDPKTFIGSLMDWSSAVTRNKTNWITVMDGFDMTMKEQAEFQSTSRAFYRKGIDGYDTIRGWQLISNNALSIIETKILTQGAAAISGQYLDRVTDQNERYVFAKDSTTPNKKTAKTYRDESFAKPNDSAGPSSQEIGWSTVPSVPEIYSGGEIGLSYGEYIDGRPRNAWLNLTHSLMKLKISVFGHGIWDSCAGLGYDTVFLRWDAKHSDDSKNRYFLNGVWLVYGFHHKLAPGSWVTDLYLSRFDYDAISQKVK